MKLTLAALLALAMAPGSSGGDASAEYLLLSDDGTVLRYYAVPSTLKISDVRSLRFPYKSGFEQSEGENLRTVTISGLNKVRVVVVFDDRGDSIDIKTTSARARDPRGVRIGHTLAEVQRAWPEGKLSHGTSSHDVRYARFSTGTNVGLDLTTKVLGSEPSKVLVKEIHIFDFKT